MKSIEQMTKPELVEELRTTIEKYNKLIDENEQLRNQLEDLQRRYTILETARKEDKDKVKKAEQEMELINQLKHELQKQYQHQINKLSQTLKEQNETLIALFAMLDNTINLQVIYYNQFKNLFVKEE